MLYTVPRPALGLHRKPKFWGKIKNAKCVGVSMEDANSNQVTDDTTGGEVLDSLGMEEPTEAMLEDGSQPHAEGDGNQGTTSALPPGVKARLGRQEKRHQREMREMREHIQQLQSMLPNNQSMNDPYAQQGNALDGVNPDIQKAVSFALAAQEAEKRKAHEREQAALIQQKYQALNDNLDKGSDKYEDFDDVVRAQDAPFTPAIRDAALFIDNAPDVLYKLGKNKEELKRISALHPLDQAREVVKLSHALLAGSERPQNGKNASQPIGQIKSNPVSNHNAITERTPPSEIRRRMKAGQFK